jgi:hypothetical protein
MMELLTLVGEKWGSSQDETYLSTCSLIEFSNEASMFHSEISKTAFCQHIRIFVVFSASPERSDLLRTVCGRTAPVCGKPVELSKMLGCELGIY